MQRTPAKRVPRVVQFAPADHVSEIAEGAPSPDGMEEIFPERLVFKRIADNTHNFVVVTLALRRELDVVV